MPPLYVSYSPVKKSDILARIFENSVCMECEMGKAGIKENKYTLL